ncbi:MAG: TolC family protein [Candidatus Eisenbacteria bacterium]|nr:TolC family protein [Candidatus Eisenbacteria bacterium]
MRYRSGIAALVFALSASWVGAAPSSEGERGGVLTLERCVSLARENAPRLRAASAGAEAARARADEASSRRFPSADLGGSYRFTSEVMKKEISIGFGLPPFALAFGDEHQADWNLGIVVPIFTGGELGRIARAEEAEARAAEKTSEAALLDLTRDVRAAFFTAMGRRAGADAAALAVDRLERRVRELDAAIRLGGATAEDRLRAEARLGDARRRMLRAEASRDSAAFELGRLIGQPGLPASPEGDLEESILKGRDLSTDRIAGRPELAAMEKRRERMESLAAAAGGRFLPRVMGDLRAHYGRPGVDVFENDWMEYATASLSLNWTLWDFGGRSAAKRRAEAGVRRADAERREMEDVFVAAHGTAESLLRSSRLEWAEAERRVELSRAIVDLVGRRRAEAEASESEYLDAEDDRAEAEIGLALAYARIRLAETALLWTLGQ